MKRATNTRRAMALAIASLVLAASHTTLARDPDSAEYYLAHAEDYLGKTIKLDVSHIEPVHFVSPSEDVAFLRVVTVDEVARRHGGAIMMILPAEDKDKVVDKYGLNHDRGRSRTMKVVLRQTPGAGPRPARYLADYEGKAWELVKDKLEQVDFDAPGGRRGPGPRAGADR